jgi:magnesium chelatase accessory protein
MASTPWAAQLFARRDWDAASVERLIQGTGSRLDAEGIALYGRLVRDPKHTAAALAMMARWDLQPLVRDLTRMTTPLACMVGDNDRAVPARDAWRMRELLPPTARGPIERIAAAGHLVHEESPALVASAIVDATKGSSSAA